MERFEGIWLPEAAKLLRSEPTIDGNGIAIDFKTWTLGGFYFLPYYFFFGCAHIDLVWH